jgi:hypothetical protein
VADRLFDDRLGRAEENVQLLRPLEQALRDQAPGLRRSDGLVVSRREWLLALLKGRAAQLEVIRDIPRRRRRWAAEFGDHGAGQFAAHTVSLSGGSATMLVRYLPFVDHVPDPEAGLCLSRDAEGQRYTLWHAGILSVGDPADAAGVAQQVVEVEGKMRAREQAAIAQRDRELDALVDRYRTDGVDVREGEALLAQMRALTTTEERRRLADVLEPVNEDHLARAREASAIRAAVNRGLGEIDGQRERTPPAPASLQR